MRYLVINGSPHKGNTWKLALVAMDYIGNAEVEFDVVHLLEIDLPFCLGCSACFRLGHEKCPHNGIIGEIIRKIEAADGVIVLSSALNLRETALLKNLFDHLCFLLHRPHFFQSKALILTTTGGVGAKKTQRVLRAFLRESDLIDAIDLALPRTAGTLIKSARKVRASSKKPLTALHLMLHPQNFIAPLPWF